MNDLTDRLARYDDLTDQGRYWTVASNLLVEYPSPAGWSIRVVEDREVSRTIEPSECFNASGVVAGWVSED